MHIGVPLFSMSLDLFAIKGFKVGQNVSSFAFFYELLANALPIQGSNLTIFCSTVLVCAIQRVLRAMSKPNLLLNQCAQLLGGDVFDRADLELVCTEDAVCA